MSLSATVVPAWLITFLSFAGFAQISNVEFYHTGQEGFSENYDARFSLTYSDVTSTAGRVRYSYVRKNTFHSGFNTAVGVFGVDDLEIDDNVVYHTVGAGMSVKHLFLLFVVEQSFI